MNDSFLFDTHALLFWNTKEFVSQSFIDFFDRQSLKGNLFASTVIFWEIALLNKKERIKIDNVLNWSKELVERSHIRLIEPTFEEMINSTLLPDFHKDPFDRLLVSQANSRQMILVTKDKMIKKYEVETNWI